MAQYKHYSKDFKLQAARLVTEQGYSLKGAAQNYSYVRMAIALKPIKQQWIDWPANTDKMVI